MMPVKKSQNWLPGIFNDFFGNEWIEKANSASPAINIIESDTDYKVELAAPGMTKDDFSVKIDADNQLVVSMEKKEEHKDEDKKGRYLRREFSYSRFQQVMILPENVEKDQDRRESAERRADHRHSEKTGSRRSEEGEGDRRQITAGGFPVPKAEKISMRKFSPLSVFGRRSRGAGTGVRPAARSVQEEAVGDGRSAPEKDRTETE